MSNDLMRPEHILPFSVTIEIYGIEDNVIMNVRLVGMSCHYECVFVFEKSACEFITQSVCLFGSDLARREALADLIGEYIAFILSARIDFILCFRKFKFRVCRVIITFIRCDEFIIPGFFGIDRVIYSARYCRSDCFARTPVHCDNSCGCHYISLSASVSFERISLTAFHIFSSSAFTEPSADSETGAPEFALAAS